MLTQTSAGRLAAALFTCLLLFAAPATVLAHADLKTPSPAADSVQTKPVTEVSGIFTEAMKKDGSSLELFDATGASVAKGGLDPADDTRMVIDLDAALVAGVYTVKWTSVALDGHVERGEWKFTVAAPPTPSPTPVPTVAPSAAPSATPSPTPAPTATPTPTPSAAPSPSGEGTATAGSGDVLLPIIVALILLAGGAAYLLNRRNRPANPA